jgi:uncharacterized protein YjiS (DUF1127 family)
MFVLLMIYILNNQPAAAVALLATLAISVVVEWVYRRRTGRRLQRLDDKSHRRNSHEVG